MSNIIDEPVAAAFRTIGEEWALLSVGNKNKYNAMTISWGAVGHIWRRNLVSVLIRTTRFTHAFAEEFDTFAVGFYERRYRPALTVMGTKSGRDCDKVALSGLTPVFLDEAVTFKEAYLTVVARKVCRMQLDASQLLVPGMDAEIYPEKDYHTIYYGEIVKVIGA